MVSDALTLLDDDAVMVAVVWLATVEVFTVN